MRKALILIGIILCLTINIVHCQTCKLISYKLFPCDKNEMDNLEIYQKRIIKKSFEGDTLTLLITTVMNCCYGDKATVLFNNDTIKLISDNADSIPTINQIGDTIGWQETEICDCSCCFTMEYKIIGIKDTSLTITINDEVIGLLPNKYIAPLYTIYKGDTLYYNDSEGFLYYYTYYDSGNLRSVKKQKYPKFYRTSYFENGQIKLETVFYKDLNYAIIKEYMENGELIRYENNLKITNYNKQYFMKYIAPKHARKGKR